jgi:hypothetical protein
MLTLAELENVLPLVRARVPPTPQYAWPLLKALSGVEVVVKHENHTPIGAFKVRGGIVYFDRLKRDRSQAARVTEIANSIAAGFGLLKQRRPCLFAGIVSAGCDRRPTCDARTYERHHQTHLLERDTELVQRCG